MSASASTTLSALPLKNTTILCVEDCEDARHFLAIYLRRRGATVIEAENGLQGLQLFKQQQLDIIITDIRMPVMNGLEMSQNIRNIDAEIPIVFLSAHSDTELLQEAIALSAMEYIIKPVDADKLASALFVVQNKINKQKKNEQTLTHLQSTISHHQDEEQRLKSYVSQMLGTGQDIAANILNQPKEAISGDFYCIEHTSNSCYAMLADGMGHGLSAVLPALNIPRKFHKLAIQEFGLCRIADELNQILYDYQLLGHFVAATLVKLDMEQHLVEVINCGNPDVVMVDSDGELLQSFSSNHLAWGIVGGDDFLPEVQTYSCQSEARVYLCSDGLTETLENHLNKPGFDILVELINNYHSDSLLKEIDIQLQEIPQEQRHDDVTLLELNYFPVTPIPSKTIELNDLLPCVPVKKKAQPFRHDPLKWLSVLFVEDDLESREHLSRYLERRVGVLYCAENGEKGLQLFKKHRPQLLISDIAMPGVNGLQLVEQIRDIDSTVPIILTSGVAKWERQAETIEAMLELEINKFLPKPLNAEKLLDAIQQCVKQYEYTQELNLSASVFMTSPLAISITDRKRDIVTVNPAFTTITGYSQAEVKGSNPRVLSSGKHDSRFYEQMWKSINDTNEWSGEIWNRHKNGDLFLEWININAIKDSQGNLTHYASVFSDITQRAAAEEKMRHLAHHDALTDLPNRVLMQDRLNQTILQAQREHTQLAVFYIDIDHFKNVNDTLGHGTGDDLIIAVAQSLQSAVRGSDTVSRLGGDEFAIILPNLDSEDITHSLPAKIFNAVSKTYSIKGKELHITVSMGICQYPQDGENVETLIKHADSAMYLAKKKGRNNFQFFDYKLEKQAERYMVIHQGLHKALEQNEFSIQYQPKYDMDKQVIVGAEALLRWNNSELGAVSPAEFIPIAEEIGFIVHIGNWVIEQVCQTMANWKAYGTPLVPIAINISPIQFHSGNLQNKLLAELTNYRIAPELIHIELTEGVVMSGEDKTIKQLLELKELGVAISIDDFGTGYSSLSYLRKLPIDELKIDRSFIMELTDESSLEDSSLTAVPLAVIDLAKNLNLELVAEGVETEIQSNFLLQNNCPIIQGYWYSKPVAASEIMSLLSSNIP